MAELLGLDLAEKLAGRRYKKGEIFRPIQAICLGKCKSAHILLSSISDSRRQVDLVIIDRSLPPTPNAVKGFPRPCDAENTSYPLASNAAEDLELAIFRLRRNQSSSSSNSELHGALLPFKHLAIVNTINIHNRTGHVVGTIPQ